MQCAVQTAHAFGAEHGQPDTALISARALCLSPEGGRFHQARHMTIVNTRYRPKRPAKKAMSATIKGSRIDNARKPGKGARPPPRAR
jgi:hypothetical protein